MANILASCVRMDQVPQRWRGLPLLGRGTTSIALRKDDDTALILTRDSMKLEWLRDGSGLSVVVRDAFETRGHHIEGMDELLVWPVEMPILHKLSPLNRSLFRAAVCDYHAVKMAPVLSGGQDLHERTMLALYERFADDEDHMLGPVFSFLRNYEACQFTLDLLARNAMQDSHGRITITDPVLSSELRELIEAHKKSMLEGNSCNERACTGPRMR